MRGNARQIKLILQQYTVLKAKLSNLEMIYHTYGSKKIRPITAIDTTKEAVSKTYKITSSTEDIALYLLEYKESIEKLQVQISVIDTAMSALTRTENEIITLKFFKNMKWKDISLKIDLSEEWCKKQKNLAFKKLIESIPVEIFPNIFFD